MKKPLQLNGLYVFAARNIITTLQARKAGLISPSDEIAEPIIVLARNIDIADAVLSLSTVSGMADISNSACCITHYILDEHKSKVRPLIKLVTENNTGFPYYMNN